MSATVQLPVRRPWWQFWRPRVAWRTSPVTETVGYLTELRLTETRWVHPLRGADYPALAKFWENGWDDVSDDDH